MTGHVYPRRVGALVFALLLSGCGGGQAWGPMTETDKNDLAMIV